MKDSTTDPRQIAILHAAWRVFSTYGFRKTSMEDIARAAGMSRPALYLHFRNKEDIYRSLVELYYAEVTEAVGLQLSQAGAPADRLTAAFKAHGGQFAEDMLSSPHGKELLDTGKAMAADIVEKGEAALRALYSAWLEESAQAGDLVLPDTPDNIALAISAALKGTLVIASDYAAFSRNRAILAGVIAQGLSPR